MQLWFAVVLLLTAPPPATSMFESYYCGTGVLSKTFSFISTAFCDREPLNLCCEQHDQCYDSGELRNVCDTSFCQCVKAAERTAVCRVWIGLTHCRVVKALGGVPYRRTQREHLRAERGVEFADIQGSELQID